MNAPEKPIACIKCNTINFSAGSCKGCGEELNVVDKDSSSKPEVQPMSPEEAREILADEIDNVTEAEAKDEPAPPKSIKPSSSLPTARNTRTPVDRELARRKLRAKLEDAKMNRARINEVTEVLDARGKRIRGARRVPYTETRPMSTSTNPYEAM
jgi:hypothetical protein